LLVNPTLAAVEIARHVHIPCHTGDYQPPRQTATTAAAKSISVNVPAGAPTATVLLFGRDAPPDAHLTGPGGRGVSATIVQSEPARATWVVLHNPRPGTYSIESLDPVTEVLKSTGYKPLRLRAALAGSGRQRSIAYRVANGGAGQRVTFVETGTFGRRVLGTARHSHGTLRFKVADARGGKRTVLALIGRAGFATETRRIGTYTAPSRLTPGRVRSLRARRNGTTVRLTWTASARAARYAVSFSDTSGTRVQRVLKGRSLVMRDVPREAAVSVVVAGIDRSGIRGPRHRARLPARGKPPAVYSRR
jgi:hypothetical protein